MRLQLMSSSFIKTTVIFMRVQFMSSSFIILQSHLWCGLLSDWYTPRAQAGTLQSFVMEILDRHDIILIDTACAKTVAGEPWAHAVTKHFSENYNYGIEKVVEKEPFRFGLCPRLWSEYALLVPCRWQVGMVIFRVSIVKRDVPPLMAKRVLH